METEIITAPVKNKFKGIDMGFMSMRLPNGLPRFAILPYSAYSNGLVSLISQWTATVTGQTPIKDYTIEENFTPYFRRGWLVNSMYVPCDYMDDRWKQDFGYVEHVGRDYFRLNLPWGADRARVIEAALKLIPDPENVITNLPEAAWANDTTQFFMAEPSSAVPAWVKEIDWLAKGFTNLRVAWEATWKALKITNHRTSENPIDPILIGEKNGKHYILATWDLTKLESYVCAEFIEDGE